MGIVAMFLLELMNYLVFCGDKGDSGDSPASAYSCKSPSHFLMWGHWGQITVNLNFVPSVPIHIKRLGTVETLMGISCPRCPQCPHVFLLSYE